MTYPISSTSGAICVATTCSTWRCVDVAGKIDELEHARRLVLCLKPVIGFLLDEIERRQAVMAGGLPFADSRFFRRDFAKLHTQLDDLAGLLDGGLVGKLDDLLDLLNLENYPSKKPLRTLNSFVTQVMLRWRANQAAAPHRQSGLTARQAAAVSQLGFRTKPPTV